MLAQIYRLFVKDELFMISLILPVIKAYKKPPKEINSPSI